MSDAQSLVEWREDEKGAVGLRKTQRPTFPRLKWQNGWGLGWCRAAAMDGTLRFAMTVDVSFCLGLGGASCFNVTAAWSMRVIGKEFRRT